MGLSAPNLDDRRFQDLVDEAKRLVQRRCPEWTDHNVSDPGVTLIEAFAYMVDQLLYRVNQLPDRSYVSFLQLMGLELFPPAAARVAVTFWLTAPRDEDLVIESGTEVATRRRRDAEAVLFRTIDDLTLPRCIVSQVMTAGTGRPAIDHLLDLASETEVPVFSSPPQPDDLLLIGLDRPVPQCAVRLDVRCDVEGYGVDPDDPPLVWEALCESGWVRCDVRDGTGGFNEPGEIVVHVPPGHASAVQDGRAAGWLRCRVVEAREDQPTYTRSPMLHTISGCTIGGTTTAVHGEDVYDEIVGVSQGVAGQRMLLRRSPVVPSGHPIEVDVSGPDGWHPWVQVPTFAESGESDHHFRLDPAEGAIVFGPAVRQPDGSLRSYGAVPAADCRVRVRRYRTGGGRSGNIAAGEIVTLTTAIPFVGRVENRRPASGGVDGETVDQAKLRGPLVLGTRDRAVTVEDYEQLAREATQQVARVRCLTVDVEGRPVSDSSGGAAGVKVLLVPAVGLDGEGRLRFEQLVPSDDLQETVRRYLDERRMVGARVLIGPPRYMGVTVVLRLRARANVDAARVRQDALDALYRHFDAFTGGPDGTGWPFGRPVLLGEVYSVVQPVRGLDLVEDARLFPADPLTGQRTEATSRIDLQPDSLVFSYGHQVQVVV